MTVRNQYVALRRRAGLWSTVLGAWMLGASAVVSAQFDIGDMSSGPGVLSFNPDVLKNLTFDPQALDKIKGPSPLFTLNVPVNAQDLHPDIDKLGIWCAAADGASAFGMGIREVPVSGRQYQGTVEVGIFSMEQGNPGFVDKFGCTLFAHIVDPPPPPDGFNMPEGYGEGWTMLGSKPCSADTVTILEELAAYICPRPAPAPQTTVEYDVPSTPDPNAPPPPKQ